MTITGNWDGRISRRTLLRTGGSAAAGIVLLGHAAAKAAPPFAAYPFSLGVASGDPTPDGIVLWTRLAPKPLEGGGLPPEVFGVRYEVAADEEFRQIVRRGAIEALPDEVHTVHAEIGGLQPATTYWYRFKWGTAESPIGRTRTAPAAGAMAAMRFAYASCQNYTNGFYTAYADMAKQDLDLVVHLGDYIYEGPGRGADRVRDHAPAAELMSLEDYRTRHAQYRTDPKLQAAHAAFPWLMTWDDHEFKDNYADLAIEPAQPLETVAERRAAAYLAYWEHAPLARSRKPVGKDMSLYRRVHWGSLATFHVLDTRQHRSDQIVQCAPAQRRNFGYCDLAIDPARSILGGTQREWLLDGLSTSTSSWNVLANQVSFAPIDRDADATVKRFAPDHWDGYVEDRQQILNLLQQRGITNMVVITGDAHENAVRHVPPHYSSFEGDPVATEFVGTSISSDGDPRTILDRTDHDPQNPQLRYFNNQRGYARVELDPQRWKNEFRVVSVAVREAPASVAATWMVDNGKPGAYRPEGVASSV